MLLSHKDIEPDQTNAYGIAPLSVTAANSHDGIVKTFLGRDDVDLHLKYRFDLRKVPRSFTWLLASCGAFDYVGSGLRHKSPAVGT
jgi:ankyrin repeat protein